VADFNLGSGRREGAQFRRAKGVSREKPEEPIGEKR